MEFFDNKSIWDNIENSHIPTDNLESISTFIDCYSFLIYEFTISFNFEKENFLSGIKLNSFILSAKMTLDSIILCTGKLRLSDAFELVRKYRDSVCFFAYTILTNKIDLGDKNIDIEKWSKNNRHDYGVKKFVKLFQTKELKDFIDRYKIRKKYNDYNKLLNNYVHLNGIKYMNNHQYCCHEGYSFYKEIIDKEVDNIYSIVTFFTLLFVSMIALVYPRSIRSTDYDDCIYLGVIPEDDSLYWCPPFLSDFFC